MKHIFQKRGKDMFKINTAELSYSDLIQLIGIIATSITSIIAIIISVFSLRQNSKMIEESSRPYISAYITSTQFGTPILYIVIKNFGNTSATISDFQSNIDLSEYTYNLNAVPFDKINGLTLSPHQKILYPIKSRNNNSKLLEKIKISFKYSDSQKTYIENIDLNVSEYYNSLNLRDYNIKEPLKTLSYSIQDISEKML